MISDPNAVTRFGLLRQAEAESDKTKWVLGQDDRPLTDEDKNQAASWGKILRHFEWDRILTDDKGRSHETALLISLSLDVPVVEDSRLQPQDLGRWNGKTLEDIAREEVELLEEYEKACGNIAPPEGEDLNSVWDRGVAALMEAYKNYPNENILVVTDELVIRCIVSRLLQDIDPEKDKSKSVIYLSNQLHRVFCHEDKLSLDVMNSLPLPYT